MKALQKYSVSPRGLFFLHHPVYIYTVSDETGYPNICRITLAIMRRILPNLVHIIISQYDTSVLNFMRFHAVVTKIHGSELVGGRWRRYHNGERYIKSGYPNICRITLAIMRRILPNLVRIIISQYDTSVLNFMRFHAVVTKIHGSEMVGGRWRRYHNGKRYITNDA